MTVSVQRWITPCVALAVVAVVCMGIRLRSRHQWPINGFKFIDAAISDQPMGDPSMGFNQLCQAVQARRAANPRFKLPTDLTQIEREVDEQNAVRMLHVRGGDSFIILDGGPAPNFPTPLQRALQSAAGGLRAAGTGAAVITEWLGSGGVPVAPPIAESRAAVCASCPLNDKGDWTRFFTVPAAEHIRRTLAVRKDLNLTTPQDEQLQVCTACKCPLKLKVHVPLVHINSYLSAEVKAKLDERCWILKEQA